MKAAQVEGRARASGLKSVAVRAAPVVGSDA